VVRQHAFIELADHRITDIVSKGAKEMELRSYFQKIKQVESTIAELFTLVVSLETGDGGKAGTFTEVSRSLAAKLIVNGLARLADATEKQAYYGQTPTETPVMTSMQPVAKANTAAQAKTNTDTPGKR
jgi:hypothetical protein